MVNPLDEKAGGRTRRKPSATQLTKREKAVEALLKQPTMERAAEAAGINAATLYRWLKEPEFQMALLQARRERHMLAQGRAQNAESFAINTLLQTMADKDAPHTAKVQASKIILDYGAKGADGLDAEMRLMH
ncbi:MAG TPA: hypothetical protein VKT49_06225, partial [Bryobacteraceae bacterium]|nr:hypothetical protein [Bryobacteraceae bacterium]